jgi:hypothetical protein
MQRDSMVAPRYGATLGLLAALIVSFLSVGAASAGGFIEGGFRRPIKLEGKLIQREDGFFLDQVKPDDAGVHTVVSPIRYRLAGDVGALREVKPGTTVKLWGRVYSDIIIATRVDKNTIPSAQ